MPVPFGTGPLILSEPFAYSNGALKAAAEWDGPMIPANGDLQVTSNQVTHGSDGAYRDAYTAASYGDADYILTVATLPANTRRLFFHVTAQAPGTSGVDTWTLDYGPQAGSDRWRLRALVDGVLQTALIDTNREGAAGMRVGVRLDGTLLAAYTDISGSGWTQLGTDQTITPLGPGRIGLESNGGALVADTLEVRSLWAGPVPAAPAQRRHHHLLVR